MFSIVVLESTSESQRVQIYSLRWRANSFPKDIDVGCWQHDAKCSVVSEQGSPNLLSIRTSHPKSTLVEQSYVPMPFDPLQLHDVWPYIL